jgi:thiol:disulfide interchange protein DsbC
MRTIHSRPLAALLLALAAGLPAARAADTDPAVSGTQHPESSPQAPAGIAAMLRGIRGMQRLPVAGVQMLAAGERLLFVSANGRYVFTGPAWDLWHGARLGSLDEAARLAGRIDLERLGLDPGSLGALDLGAGEGEVLAFVDPRCPHCRALLDELPGLAGDYRFRLVPLPVLGPDSERAVMRLACLADADPAAAREALLADRIDGLPEPDGTCGQAPAQRALVTAQLLGITGVPYLIAPDGRLRQGAPADLRAWLEGHE